MVFSKRSSVALKVTSAYNGDVWYKSAVHDIYMDPVCSSSLDCLDLQGPEYQLLEPSVHC